MLQCLQLVDSGPIVTLRAWDTVRMLSLDTLADLTDYHLYGVCNTCSRMERLKMLVLYDRLGPEQPIASVSRHLKMQGMRRTGLWDQDRVGWGG